ncbi:MAG: hypothetical protein AAF739_10030 [Pseudomonadota bacterium]
MPTTIRMLLRLCLLLAIAAGAIYALANYVEPTPQPLSVRVPTDRFE